MPTSFTDQFFTFDPANPPDPGTVVTVQQFTLTDQNDDGDIDEFDDDAVAGLDVTASWPGDTVTIIVPGVGDVTYVGTTIYISDGSVIFTPTDGQVLSGGEFVSSTYVTTQGPLLTSQLGPPCFLPGTLISTPTGSIKVEDLRVGDLVCVLGGSAMPVAYIRHRRISAQHLRANPRHAPIRIPGTAFSLTSNHADLFVSPQHRMLIRSKIAQRMYGEQEILAPAAQLIGFKGIRRVETEKPFSYIHLLLSEHSIIEANGLGTESLFLGRSVLADLSRSEMRTIRKTLNPSEIFAMTPARVFANGKKLKQLLLRHQKNGTPLCGEPREYMPNVA
ncbi:Hint domain-containing protein [Gymnodinialimonas hymeniacidonis]|uniref:Hint domain-containing protein n=1 Tax=Gymnodinialimonas hymeniacidonis TaxID=3126508 RepID=UPI0034C6A86B